MGAEFLKLNWVINLTIDPCFYFGEFHKTTVAGPLFINDDDAFVLRPMETSNVGFIPIITYIFEISEARVFVN